MLSDLINSCPKVTVRLMLWIQYGKKISNWFMANDGVTIKLKVMVNQFKYQTCAVFMHCNYKI